MREDPYGVPSGYVPRGPFIGPRNQYGHRDVEEEQIQAMRNIAAPIPNYVPPSPEKKDISALLKEAYEQGRKDATEARHFLDKLVAVSRE